MEAGAGGSTLVVSKREQETLALPIHSVAVAGAARGGASSTPHFEKKIYTTGCQLQDKQPSKTG